MKFEHLVSKAIIRTFILLSIVAGRTGSTQVLAQSTIFNIPSTDVEAKDRGSLRFDFIVHLERDEDR